MTRAAEQGFTLVESMIALAMVGLVAVAVLGQIGTTSAAAANSVAALTATSLAQARLDSLQLLDADRLLAPAAAEASGRFAPPNEAYTWSFEAERLRGEPALIDASIDVAWSDGSVALRTRWYRP